MCSIFMLPQFRKIVHIRSVFGIDQNRVQTIDDLVVEMIVSSSDRSSGFGGSRQETLRS